MTLLEDRMAFLLAVDRVEPRVFQELRALGPSATWLGVEAWRDRWHLDIARLDVGELLMEARVGFDTVPALAGGVPTHDLALPPLSWEPAATRERRSEFIARAMREVEAYADHVEEWAVGHGVTPPSVERATGEAEAGVPRWDLLASRIVLGQSYQEIGAAIGITKQGAAKHVRKLAERLGILLP